MMNPATFEEEFAWLERIFGNSASRVTDTVSEQTTIQGFGEVYQEQALKAEGEEKLALAAGYREAALTLERAADQWKLAAQVYAPGREERSLSWVKSAQSLQAKADYQVKACEAEGAGNIRLAAGYKEAARISESAADQRQLSAQNYSIKRADESDCWYWAGFSLQEKAIYQAKASEAEEVGKNRLAIGYREAARISESAADQYQQSALAYIAGIYHEGVSKSDHGEFLQKKANLQAKTMEAEEADKERLVAGYQEAVVTLERFTDEHKKSALATATGSWSESLSWRLAALSLQNKADYQVKASETEEVGEVHLSGAQREAARISEYAVDQYQQSALAFAAGKEDEGHGYYLIGEYLRLRESYQEGAWNSQCSRGLPTTGIPCTSSASASLERSLIKKMALSLCCEKWLAETRSAEGSVKILPDYIRDVVKRGADPQLVRAFEKYWSYVAKAYQLGNEPLALAWIQVAEDIQQAIEDSISYQAAKTSIPGDSSLCGAWKDAVQATQKIAEYREKYIQSSVSLKTGSKTPEMVSVLKKIVEELESVANYSRKAAEARVLKNEQEYNRYNGMVHSMKERVSELEQATCST